MMAGNCSYFYLELKAVIAYLAWVRFKSDKCTEQLRQLWISLRVKFKFIFDQARGLASSFFKLSIISHGILYSKSQTEWNLGARLVHPCIVKTTPQYW